MICIGDASWRKLAADVLRGVRKFDRKLAQRFRDEMDVMLRTRRGEICGHTQHWERNGGDQTSRRMEYHEPCGCAVSPARRDVLRARAF